MKTIQRRRVQSLFPQDVADWQVSAHGDKFFLPATTIHSETVVTNSTTTTTTTTPISRQQATVKPTTTTTASAAATTTTTTTRPSSRHRFVVSMLPHEALPQPSVHGDNFFLASSLSQRQS